MNSKGHINLLINTIILYNIKNKFKMDKYHIVSHPNGDWEGLYKNGKLLDEGHSGMENILMSILITEGVVDMDEFEADMDEDTDSMPEDLPKEA